MKETIKLPSILEEFLHYLTSVQGRAAGTVNGYCSDLILFLVNRPLSVA